MRVKTVVKDAANGWLDHNAPRLGAALSFYAASSLGPLLLIALAIAGAIFGRDAARNKIFADLRGLLGAPAALVVQQTIEGSSQMSSSIPATIIGVILLFVAASGVFAELHGGLNTVLGIRSQPNQGARAFVRERVVSFAMVISLGFILLVSLLLGAIMSAAGGWVGARMPGGEALWQIVASLVTFALTSVVFAVIFRLVPDKHGRWPHVLIAGAVTAGLFTLGRAGLVLYLRVGNVGSAYGAAGSVIILLMWVYFTALVVYFGAEVARALGAPPLMAEAASRPTTVVPGVNGPHGATGHQH